MTCFWCDGEAGAATQGPASGGQELKGGGRRQPVDLPAASCAGLMLRGSDGRLYRSALAKNGRAWAWEFAADAALH